MQQTLLGTGLGTNLGRKKREIPGVNPLLNSQIIYLIDIFSKAIQKYEKKN